MLVVDSTVVTVELGEEQVEPPSDLEASLVVDQLVREAAGVAHGLL